MARSSSSNSSSSESSSSTDVKAPTSLRRWIDRNRRRNRHKKEEKKEGKKESKKEEKKGGKEGKKVVKKDNLKKLPKKDVKKVKPHAKRNNKKDKHHSSHESEYIEKRRNVNGKLDIEVIHERDGVPVSESEDRQKSTHSHNNDQNNDPSQSARSQGQGSYEYNRDEQRRICQANVTTAEELAEFFVGFKFADLATHPTVRNDVILEITDRAQKIPYAGKFVGREEFRRGLAKLNDHVVPTTVVKEETFINIDCSKIIVTVKACQINRAAPAAVSTIPFETLLYLTFGFDETDLQSLRLDFDTGALDLFYSKKE